MAAEWRSKVYGIGLPFDHPIWSGIRQGSGVTAPTTNDLLARLVTRLASPVVFEQSVAWTIPHVWKCSLCGEEADGPRPLDITDAEMERYTEDDPPPAPEPFPHADDCPSVLAKRLAERLGLEVAL